MTDNLLAARRNPELLSRHDTQLAVIDMQARLVAVMPDSQQLVDNCRKLMAGARLFEVPVTVTEQYPAGLGNTIESLSELASGVPFEKLRFSACEAFVSSGEAGPDRRPRVVLCGVEAHVCVLQTAFDLASNGFRVSVAADAIGSQRPLDRELAVRRMSDTGITVTTTEAVLFEWCESAEDAKFRELQKIVKPR